MATFNRITWFIVLAWHLLLPLRSQADVPSGPEQISLVNVGNFTPHQMNALSSTRFQAAGKDPFIVSAVVDRPMNETGGIDIRFSWVGPVPAAGMFQLFWKMSGTDYTPKNSFSFRVDTSVAHYHIFLPFTDELTQAYAQEILQSVRLDVPENCPGCILEITEVRILDRKTSGPVERIPHDLIYPVIERNIFPDISRTDAVDLQDLKGRFPGVLEKAGDDPYILFRNIDYAAGKIAGIRFVMVFPENSGKECRMQLFWSTYSQPFDEKRSFWFSVRSGGKPIDFWIPLNQISKNELVKAVRLDLDPAHLQTVRILDASLIEAGTTPVHAQIPVRIVPMSRKNLMELNTLRHVFSRLILDPVFMIVYVLLLAAVGYGILSVRRHIRFLGTPVVKKKPS